MALPSLCKKRLLGVNRTSSKWGFHLSLRLLGDAVKREVPSHSSRDRHAERTDGKTFVRTCIMLRSSGRDVGSIATQRISRRSASGSPGCRAAWFHSTGLDAADLSRSRKTRPKVKVRLVTGRQQASVA
jgi:hypothetical protein